MGKVETLNCPLSAGGTLEHILSSCPTALGQGQYTWRHVLKPIAEAMSKRISSCSHVRNPAHTIAMSRQGSSQQQDTIGILAMAQDWQLSVDLKKQLRFSQHIVSTTLRPDKLQVSESTKNIIIMEVTLPWQDCLGEDHEKKRTKYEHRVTNC